MSLQIETLLVSSLDVCGGRLRIDGTRITVNQIVVWYKQGYSAEEIVSEYPQLSLAQVYTALAYYHVNREEIEADLLAEKEEVERLEAQFSRDDLMRTRLYVDEDAMSRAGARASSARRGCNNGV
jgi:uncharacterized protein (DUF433 family)